MALHEHVLSITDFTRSIELNPDYAEAYFYRGFAYSMKSEIDNAIADYTKAIELQPDKPIAYYHRGEAWLLLKEWKKAKADLITAKNMGMNIVEAFRSTYRHTAAFERKNGFKLREDIAVLLIHR